MNVLASPCWYGALTLAERLEALRAATGQPSPSDLSAATARLEAWKAQPPFERDDFFARRLAASGMTEEELLRILGGPAEAVPSRLASPPTWLETLRRAFEAPRPPASAPGAEAREPPSFVEIARPLIAAGRARLRQALGALAERSFVPFDLDATTDGVVLHLGLELLHLIQRTLVLELNVARLKGELDGTTPEERFRSFLLRMRDPERALALLAEYPVLARQLVRAVDHGVAFHLEFLERLTRDWGILRGALCAGSDPGKLEEVTGGIGDSHRKGRSVLIARFESGLKVVYKPRPLALDLHFQQLLSWANERGNDPPFRTLRILDRGDYGWVEFIEARGCDTPGEVDRFYRRQGAYLALLYALDATDFHTENLIAEGEHPVLLDLEALFHARAGRALVTNPAHRAAIKSIENSVLRVGLLPQRVWATAESEGIDVSGLGATGGQVTPFPVPQWRRGGTDEMHLGRERVAMPIGQNRPTLAGADVDVVDHADAIAAGFTAMYGLVERNRNELLSAQGPLARFADDDVRVILRPTQSYGVLLRESFHPDVLRDELDRAQLFDRLWILVEQLPHLARSIPAEVDDLAEGDIPMFTTRPGSCDLWSSSGERLPGFFEEPSMSHVRRRLEDMGSGDLERQLWFVRASLSTASRKPSLVRGAPPAQTAGPVDRDELLAAARAVGDELERRALREEGAATWIGLTQPREAHWTLEPLGLALYDGLPGVAMFLAYLGAVTGEARYASLARAALRAVRQDLPGARERLATIGAFSGLGGLVYALTHLGVLWRDADLLAEARATVVDLARCIERDEYLDVIAGSAGCIGALLSLHRHDRGEETLSVARQCGERLLATAKPMDRGIGWLTHIARTRPLSGFSHGAAGMAWALLRLASATGEPRFHRAALDAIAYERTLFSPEQGNWWDLRDLGAAGASPGPAHCTTTWCHGAPGIGLARLGTLDILDDERVREEIGAALGTVLREGFGDSHSLCHGDLGNLELLYSAARVLDDPAMLTRTSSIARSIVDDIRSAGWQCGNPLRVESPGLMTGLAGIGYGLLRLADPGRIPNVLLLEEPRAV